MAGTTSTDTETDGFEDAVFISYTHIDNQPFGPDEQQWVTYLHEQLTSRLTQLFGQQVTVWRDDKLQGNDVFAETLVDRLSKVAVLISVCSPRYLHSEWCQRELDTFLESAKSGSGVQVGTKSRVFKVMKTPVPRDELPDDLVSLLGYEFYEEAPVGDRIREFLLNPDPSERWKFYARVDDLAQDIAKLLDTLPSEDPLAAEDASTVSNSPPSRGTVYLAQGTTDINPARDNIKRELERRGMTVLPQRTLSQTIEEAEESVAEDLQRSGVSIHLLGKRYGVRPEGDDRSIPHLQVALAGVAAASSDGMTQLIWIPEDLDDVEDAQQKLIDRLQEENLGPSVEVLRTSPEAFKSHLLDVLSRRDQPAPTQETPTDAKRIYLIHDPGDRDGAAVVQRTLESSGNIVMVPLGEGTETEAREVHEMSMVLCDAVLIYYGNATEHWLKMKLFDLVKAPGWGRDKPFVSSAVLMAEPACEHKASFVTNEVLLLDATQQPVESALEQFLAEVTPESTSPVRS